LAEIICGDTVAGIDFALGLIKGGEKLPILVAIERINSTPARDEPAFESIALGGR